MFDPDSVRREMEQLLGAAASDRARTPNGGRAPTAMSAPPAPRSGRTVAAPRGMLLLAGVVVATVVIPLLVVVGSLAIPAWKRRMTVAPFAAVPAATPVSKAPAAASGGTPPRGASAYTVLAREGPAVARAVPHRRWRRAGRMRRDRPQELTGSALERAVAEDAVVTKHLNDAAMDRLRPTLGYSPAIVDQAPPR